MNVRPAAVDAHNRGLAVFRLARGAKVPEAKSHGHLDAVSDLDALLQMFKDDRCNLGIATGEPSGVFVIEVDTSDGGHEDGRKAFKALIAELGKLPETFTVRSPSGSIHLYFKMPADGSDVRNLTHKANVLAPGVDVKGTGGYVVAAGSRTPKGEYEIVRRAEFAELPAAWLERIRERRSTSTRIEIFDSTPFEVHDDSLRRLGVQLERSGVLDHELRADILERIAERHCPMPAGREPFTRADYMRQARPFDPYSLSAAINSGGLSQWNEDGEPARPSGGVTWAEALAVEVPPADHLVAGMIEAGTLGTIAGEPETYKSWLALHLGTCVASGRMALGMHVTKQGAVGYFWQDDSEANELRRVQAYAERHKLADVSLRLHLNEGWVLPRDLDSLGECIIEHGYRLVILDSLYNFAVGLDLKDAEVGELYQRIKSEVCDVTGCAVLIVDHAAWTTDENRGRLGAYGSIFKKAAIRWGLYAKRASGGKIALTGGGNNIAGVGKLTLTWDAEALAFDVIDTSRADDDDLDSRVEQFIRDNAGCSAARIHVGVKGGKDRINGALDRLYESDRIAKGHDGRGNTYAVTEALES